MYLTTCCGVGGFEAAVRARDQDEITRPEQRVVGGRGAFLPSGDGVVGRVCQRRPRRPWAVMGVRPAVEHVGLAEWGEGEGDGDPLGIGCCGRD
jgi:hypothetical protein